MHKMRTVLGLLLTCVATLAPLPGAKAEGYPERNITLIVPVPPGGAGDFVGRLVASRLADALGTKIVVDNRGGASGTIAAAAVARAAPDGYTLLLSSSTTHATAPAALKVLPYDPNKDFTHLGLVATAPAVLSVNAALPANSIAELVAYAKRNPDLLNYGSSGVGGPGHFWGEMFEAASAIRMVHVPYKGTGPAMLDLVAGQIQVLLDGLPSQLSNIGAGTIRPLAALSADRLPLVPQVPTMAEAGYPTVIGGLWFGVSGPAGLPGDIAERLSIELAKIAEDTALRGKLQAAGIIVTPLRGSPYARFIADEISRYRKIAQDAKISVD